jgi:gliding motility-associated-like protein
MKLKLVSILLLYCSLVFSQKEASVWYFGDKAGLKFNADNTVTALNDGQLITPEGCSSIADSNGNLLFYSDGKSVWDRNHVIMPNGNYVLGTGLFGDSSSTQSAIIVPKPNDANIYYIFTVDEPQFDNANVYPNVFSGTYIDLTATPNDDNGLNNGFNYSIVDLSVIGTNGSIGDVVSRNNHLVTYDPNPTGEEIKYKCSEKITAVKDDASNSYWVITQFVNTFYAFRVSSLGVNTNPVTSTLLPTIPLSGYRKNAQGYLKASPDGSKLAIAHSQNITAPNLEDFATGLLYVYDFNSATGIVSNPVLVTTVDRVYGVEFSDNSNVLYVSYETNNSSQNTKLAQFDLLSSNIPNSKIILNHVNASAGALQLGINSKIYYSYTYNYLGVINNPNIIGTGCNYVANGQLLAPGTTSYYGLPPFITSLFNASFTAQNICFGAATQFTLNSNQPVTSVFWDFGDTFTSTDTNPIHQYTNSGNYNVSVTVTTTNGTVTKSRQIIISTVPIIANPIANQSLCGTANMSYNLTSFNATVLGSQSASVYGVAYFISLANATSHTNAFATTYNLTLGTTTLFAKVYNLSNVNCFAVTSFTVTLFNQPIANTASNLFVCDDVTNDGIGNFNLQNNTAAVLGSQNTSDYAVTYHYTQNDADMDVNELALNYQNTSNPQTIYVRIENNLNTTCFATTSFQIGLYALPIANQPSNLYECDAGNDGIESFNLSVQDAVVLGSQTAGNFAIRYYSSQADADSGTNPLVSTVTITNSKTIYVRIENVLSSSCYATAFFDLIIEPSPVITMQTSYTICEGVPITITAPSGFSSYSWSNGSMVQTATISNAGSYTLTVTQNYGAIICSDTTTITVLNSNIATITNIETLDWTATENSITVFATGDGDYEYSIDGIHYQDSNQFYGLISGQYSVFVRDKKGCGIVDEEVFLLMYPKFFTPNSDAINDFWKIKFSNNEPNMVITIYDRYGKLLKKVSSLSDGWDGTYNGQPLLADDYWFVVKRENGKEYKGHFCLKR